MDVGVYEYVYLLGVYVDVYVAWVSVRKKEWRKEIGGRNRATGEGGEGIPWESWKRKRGGGSGGQVTSSAARN